MVSYFQTKILPHKPKIGVPTAFGSVYPEICTILYLLMKMYPNENSFGRKGTRQLWHRTPFCTEGEFGLVNVYKYKRYEIEFSKKIIFKK